MVNPSKILVYGVDPTLLHTRAWVLTRAGFNVRITTEAEEFQCEVEQGGIELLILCHTLSDQQMLSATELAQTNRAAVRQILMVVSHCSPLSDVRIPTVDPLCGTQVFIQAVKDLLHSPVPLQQAVR